MKTPKTFKMASMLLAGASLLTVGLTSCTPSENPSEADAKASTSVTVAPDASNTDKASAIIVNYADGVKDKDSQKVCDNLDKRLISLTIDAVDPKTDGTSSSKSCEEIFDTVLASAETDTEISDNINMADVSSKATEVSPTMYSFPASAISADSESTLFVGNINGEWKITFDPAEEEAVKQLEAEKNAAKATPAPSESAPAPAATTAAP